MVHQLTSATEIEAYNAFVKNHPQGSLWQSVEWKNYQESLGREVRIYRDDHASALIVIDRTIGGLSTWDIPRGPLGHSKELLPLIVEHAKKDKCLSIYLSPSSKLEAKSQKLKASSRTEQPEATRVLDLTKSEDELLAQMHQKGRYNIKVAEKNGVRVKQSNDIEAYAALAKATAGRDGFKGASKKQYEAFLKNLPGSFLLLASAENKPIAGLLGVIWNGIGIYYYGASDHTYRNLMAPYLLQWEAMKHCKNLGAKSYDLFGIAPPEAGAIHAWAGISGFKEKFGGMVLTYPPEQEIRLRPLTSTLLRLKRRIAG